MKFHVNSTFSYNGDLNATLNTLTHVVNPDTSKTIADLSTDNYPGVTGETRSVKPNATNQTILMNQPMSWWIENLTSGKIAYLPYSNYVNWGYTPANTSCIHISMDISNLLLPNAMNTSSKDSSGNITMVFKEKLGMNRTDVRS